MLRLSSSYEQHSADVAALGPILIQGACTILAIRTARRDARLDAHTASVEWQQEIAFALDLANRVIMHATAKHASCFQQKVTPFSTSAKPVTERE